MLIKPAVPVTNQSRFENEGCAGSCGFLGSSWASGTFQSRSGMHSEVSDRVWVSQCIPRVYHTCCKAVSFTLQFLVFCTAMLCACDSCSFTTEDHIRCFVNLFCCIRTSDDFTKFVAWYSLYVALLWSLRIAGICLVGICDHCVIKHPTYPVRCTFVGQVRHRQNRYFIQRRKRESRRCSIQHIVKLAALMIYVSLWSHFLVTPKVSVRRNMVHVHALTYIVHATFRIASPSSLLTCHHSSHLEGLKKIS